MSNLTANGLKPWLIQRLSAIYLALFSFIMLIVLIQLSPQSYEEWKNLFSLPIVNVASGIFFVSLLLHIWVGLRDILIDYVHPVVIRMVLLAVVLVILIAMGLWSLKILFSLTL